MKITFLFILCIALLTGYSFETGKSPKELGCTMEKPVVQKQAPQQDPHRYGGWYCPDNLGGFPAVDIEDWDKVPVVNGRMPTEEDFRNGASLINVDRTKYPDARPLDMEMPRLARYQCQASGKNELIIVIQAIEVQEDSIVGFRYLNGGNGSSRLHEVDFLSDEEIAKLPSSRFVSIDMTINAPKMTIWEVLTDQQYSKKLQPTFDKNNDLPNGWDNVTKVNFKYPNAGRVTSAYAGTLFGNQYIQIDCEKDDYQYVEKFFVSEDEETKTSHFVIVCGPYRLDYKQQKTALEDWAAMVKETAEAIDN